MQTLRSTAALALAAALVAMPLDAQDRPAQQQARCTATITPAQLPAGQAAARLNVSFSEDVGELTRVQAEDSGIVLAQARDLPRTDLAANAPTPRPIAMGEQRNSWTVFVNTQNARPGSHGMTFVGANGGCTAQIQIQAGQQGRQGGAQPGQQPSGGAQPAQPGAQPRPGAQPGQPSGGSTQPTSPTTPPAGGSTRPSPTTPPTTPRPNN